MRISFKTLFNPGCGPSLESITVARDAFSAPSHLVTKISIFVVYSEFQGSKNISKLLGKKFPGGPKGSPGNFLGESEKLRGVGVNGNLCLGP